MKKGAYEYLCKNQENHWWNIGKNDYIIRVLKHIAESGNRPKILEIGSSYGVLTKKIRQFADCVGVDISFESITHGGYHSGICCDSRFLPFKKKSFDIVLAVDLLEHLKDDYSCMLEIKEILVSDGVFVAFVPAFPFLWSDMDLLAGHHRRYTIKSLKSLLLKVPGLRIININYFNSFLFVPIAIIRLLQRIIKLIKKDISTESLGAPPKIINEILKIILLFESRFAMIYKVPIGVSLLAVVKKESLNNER